MFGFERSFGVLVVVGILVDLIDVVNYALIARIAVKLFVFSLVQIFFNYSWGDKFYAGFVL